MLNHIWLALLVIGILTAAGRDIHDAVTNAYGNGIPWSLRSEDVTALKGPGRHTTTVTLTAAELHRHFPSMAAKGADVQCAASIVLHSDAEGSMVLTPPEGGPAILSTLAEAQGGSAITGTVSAMQQDGETRWVFNAQPVRLVLLRKITIAAFDAAVLGVQIAIGLIGIMALWLGVMNVAQEAGLITLVARAVRPLTRHLFPDVPPDHPAIGAIVMNVSANMLGLGNAATPFGLKAMEELNKVSTRPGTASNAMCTFLAMNTSCVTLIPATAIAVRATLGSSNPAAIIGTTLLASLFAAIVGITTAKMLQRLPLYRLDKGAS